MRLLVCGCRDFFDEYVIGGEMTDERQAAQDRCFVIEPPEECTLIHGAADGVDTVAAELAADWGWEVIPFPAKWSEHGKAAGPIRNQQMLDEGKPDRVLAFWQGKVRNSGTLDMIQRAVKAGVPVRTGRAACE